MKRVERAGTLTGPADGPNTTNAQKPIHNATPVQTRVVVMMCSRQKQAGITSGDLHESGKSGGVRIQVAILGIARRQHP